MPDHVPAYSFTSPRRQLFAFPPDMIASMLKNPSSSIGLKKLYQTCKYFYAKRPILIADRMVVKKDFRTGETTVGFTSKDFKKNIVDFRTPIWLTKEVFFDDVFIESHRFPKLFRSSVEEIMLINAAIEYEDFVLLTSEKTVKSLFVGRRSRIFRKQISHVSINDILQNLPNIREFTYFLDEKCSLEVLTKLNEIKLSHPFLSFLLDINGIHSTFDMNLFCDFILKNSNNRTCIWLNPREESVKKLKTALRKLDSKWKTGIHPGLEQFFDKIDYNWEEEMDE